MIVSKFGGSSLANASQFQKVCSIMRANPERKIMVVSAPGKRLSVPGDIKLTDRLIALADTKEQESRVDTDIVNAIDEQIRSICTGLSLPDTLPDQLKDDIITFAQNVDINKPWTRADLIATGEMASATIATAYLQSMGTPARMVDPRKAGLLVSSSDSKMSILPQTYLLLEHLKWTEEILCVPGFFGVDEQGHTVLFSRGGSDITGSVLAKATGAKLYENWTDRDSVFAVNPEIIEPTDPILEISYREMRELAYMGFSILHPEALEPVIEQRIPVHIRNTNNPSAPGTKIIPERTHIERAITGIAASDQFVALSLRRVLINQEIGILHRILRFFVDESINVHHVPTGIDSVSIIVRDDALTLEKEQRIRERLEDELGISDVIVTRGLAIIIMVGEGIRDDVDVLAKATCALAEERISIETVILDYFEISLIFMVRDHDKTRAVSALYRTFFKKKPDDKSKIML
ncbi:MAG: aspartate kinase [Clostridiaceae bacterium]|nr:aspartate kinase [Clostridiaceae bacterium]